MTNNHESSNSGRSLLGEHLAGFARWLEERGYARSTVEKWSCPTFVDTLGVRRNEEATMPKTHRPYAPEFRQQMVELVQSGRTPEELALEYEPSAAAIRNWVAQQERDAGRREDGLSSDERQELRRLRRENKQLRIERDILKKAAAWFARESDSIPERGSSS